MDGIVCVSVFVFKSGALYTGLNIPNLSDAVTHFNVGVLGSLDPSLAANQQRDRLNKAHGLAAVISRIEFRRS